MGFKESVSGVGLGGAAPRMAGDERRPPGQSMAAGELARGARAASSSSGVFLGDQGGRQREELGGELTDGDGQRRWRGNRKLAAKRGRGEGGSEEVFAAEGRHGTERARPGKEGGRGGARSSSSRVHACTDSSGARRRTATTRARRAATRRRRWFGGNGVVGMRRAKTREEGSLGRLGFYSGGDVGLGGGGKLVLGWRPRAGSAFSWAARNMATAWMDWAAKAVDRTAEFSSCEHGLARSRSESWQPCSELAAMRRQSMTVAEVEVMVKRKRERRACPCHLGRKREGERGSASGIWTRAHRGGGDVATGHGRRQG